MKKLKKKALKRINQHWIPSWIGNLFIKILRRRKTSEVLNGTSFSRNDFLKDSWAPIKAKFPSKCVYLFPQIQNAHLKNLMRYHFLLHRSSLEFQFMRRHFVFSNMFEKFYDSELRKREHSPLIGEKGYWIYTNFFFCSIGDGNTFFGNRMSFFFAFF